MSILVTLKDDIIVLGKMRDILIKGYNIERKILFLIDFKGGGSQDNVCIFYVYITRIFL